MNTNLNPTPTVTRRLAGHDITLTDGHWYIATRPIATRRSETYTVTIRDDAGDEVLTIPDLSYTAANDLLAAFNNGTSSFDGRTW